MAGAVRSEQVIDDQLKKCSIKRNVDVSELYIARKGLTEVIDLSRFKMLRYLWLNHNKLRKITFLTNNYRLSELYLNNNALVDISGALRHLTTLQILMLHNNQLTNLEMTVKELREMTCLQVLNLFQNPLSQDSMYRLYVVCLLPSVQLLDRRRVTEKEKEAAFNIFSPDRAHILHSLAFGRRVDTVLVPGKKKKAPTFKSKTFSGNHTFVNNLHRTVFDNPSDAAFWRAMQRSVMQFSLVDWSKIPTSKQKRLEDKANETLQLLTIQFR
uniref:Leucine-rich repeat-containing protein 72 isoform X2 n=1 Tax=Geotrypetes seraphini TaxID=260995 RepID=A0A6P8QJE8_GEOSA|nr:leucine-rich repeat-containing protein 72 isoform X2 [Geotrypetes seraphini]